MIEGKLTEDGLFDTNVDVVILSSNNILSIFVHAYISIHYPVLDNSFVETKILTLMYTIMTNMVWVLTRELIRYLAIDMNKLNNIALNEMTKPYRDELLSIFDNMIFGKIDKDDNDDDSNIENNEPNTNKEFSSKRELYDYYWIDVKSIPDRMEIKMIDVNSNGKMSRLYKLMKKMK